MRMLELNNSHPRHRRCWCMEKYIVKLDLSVSHMARYSNI